MVTAADGVALDHRDHGEGDEAIVVVPGLTESADDYLELLEALAPRRAVAVTLRGRGRSGAPATGYTLDDHAGDVAAVVDALGLRPVVVAGFSRGTPTAIRFATRHGGVRALVLGDYPAVHTRPPAGFAEAVYAQTWRGRAVHDRMAIATLEAIAREADPAELWNELAATGADITLLAGTTAGSFVTPELRAHYRAAVPSIAIVDIPGCGHDLFTDGPGPVAAVLAARLLCYERA